MIGYMFSSFMAKMFGLKPALCISYLIAMSGMAALLMTTTMNQVLLCIFILMSKLGITCAIGTAYVTNYQLFPPSIVATVFGLINIMARSSAILAPYIVELKPFSICQWSFVFITTLSAIIS